MTATPRGKPPDAKRGPGAGATFQFRLLGAGHEEATTGPPPCRCMRPGGGPCFGIVDERLAMLQIDPAAAERQLEAGRHKQANRMVILAEQSSPTITYLKGRVRIHGRPDELVRSAW